jgi:hypothetical protein
MDNGKSPRELTADGPGDTQIPSNYTVRQMGIDELPYFKKDGLNGVAFAGGVIGKHLDEELADKVVSHNSTTLIDDASKALY